MQKFNIFLSVFSIILSTQALAEDQASIAKFEAKLGEKHKSEEALDLSGHDFTKHKDLSRFNFVSANLKGSNFSGMVLEGTQFAGADLEGANFEGATLTGCNFKGAQLRKAHFDNATLERSNFYGTRMDYTYFDNASIEATNFDKSKMHCVYLDNAIIERANFRGVKAHGISLKGTKMSATNKENAVWETDMTHCKE